MRRRVIGRAGWGRTALCAIVGFVYFLPVLWIVLTAFKSPRDILSSTLAFTPTLDNFANIFARVHYQGGALIETGFELYFVNSIVVSGASVGLALILGTAAAYGFSRWPLKGNDTYLLVVLTARMLPPIVLIIPLFVIFRMTGLAGSYLGIILLYTAFNLPFAIWMMKSFFDDLPREVEDAARTDGSSEMAGLLPRLPTSGEGRHCRDGDARPDPHLERVPDGVAAHGAGDADRPGRHGGQPRQRQRRGLGQARCDRDALPDPGRPGDLRPPEPAAQGRDLRHHHARTPRALARKPHPVMVG